MSDIVNMKKVVISIIAVVAVVAVAAAWWLYESFYGG